MLTPERKAELRRLTFKWLRVRPGSNAEERLFSRDVVDEDEPLLERIFGAPEPVVLGGSATAANGPFPVPLDWMAM